MGRRNQIGHFGRGSVTDGTDLVVRSIGECPAGDHPHYSPKVTLRPDRHLDGGDALPENLLQLTQYAGKGGALAVEFRDHDRPGDALFFGNLPHEFGLDLDSVDSRDHE